MCNQKKKSNLLKVFLILVLPIFLISFISADLSTGIEGQIGIDLIPDVPTNFSAVNVNNSDFWDSLDTPLDITANGIWTRNGTNIHQRNIGDRVGIGTTSPAEALDVVGNIDASGGLIGTSGKISGILRVDEIRADSNTAPLILRGGTGGGRGYDLQLIAASGFGRQIEGKSTQLGDFVTGASFLHGVDAFASATTNLDGGNFSLKGGDGSSGSAGDADGGSVLLDGGIGFGTGSHGNILLGSLRGNVGIGTINPSYLLDVAGNFSVNNILYVTQTSNVGIGTTNPSGLLNINGSGTLLNITNGSDGDNVFIVDSSGSIGLSKITPSTRLHIKGDTGTDSNARFLSSAITIENDVTSGAGYSVIYFVDGGTVGSLRNWISYQHQDGGGAVDAFRFGIDNNEEMRLDSIGLGIKTTTPKAVLDVVGNTSVSGNITSENVFLKQYLFAHDNRTTSLTGAGAWANISFDQEVVAIKKGISHTFNDNTNNTFTINEAGIYEINYNLDVIDTSVSASDIDVAGRVIFFNGTEILGSIFETDITKQNIENELSHSLLAQLGAGDKIIFQFTADDADVEVSTHGTFGDHTDSATIKIEKVANL